jgi:lipoprotein-anchoring transpeptidase ErfK/SrfK
VRRLVVLTPLILVALLGAAGGVYAYDSSRKTRMADGVAIGGLDVSGMEAAEARAKLRAMVLEPLDRPVKIRYRARRFTLTPAAADVSVDIDGAISRAMAASREGNIVERTWRGLTGGRVRKDIGVRIGYSAAAVRSLVRRIRRRVDKRPVDAALDLESGRIDPRPAEEGLRVRSTQLHRDIRRQLLETGARRTVRVRTEVVKPKVTTADLKRRYPAIIVINRSAFQLTLYKRLKRAKTYAVGVGRSGFDTPAGLYDIQNKAVDPAWFVPDREWAGELAGQVIPADDPRNPIEARWMGIYDGAGIHGTEDVGSIGNAESHGCIRMRIAEVKELYEQVPVGSPVYIR